MSYRAEGNGHTVVTSVEIYCACQGASARCLPLHRGAQAEYRTVATTAARLRCRGPSLCARRQRDALNGSEQGALGHLAETEDEVPARLGNVGRMPRGKQIPARSAAPWTEVSGKIP